MALGVQPARKRSLRPRATASLVVAPIVITERSAPAVAGLEAREFRDLVASLQIRRVPNTRRVVVLVSDFVAALERASLKTVCSDEVATDDDTPTSVDSLLARMGRRRSA